MAIPILVASLVVWGAIHSWLASLRWKLVVRRWIGERRMGAYRLAYNGFALLSFLPIMVLLKVLPNHQIYAVAAPWLYFMVMGQAVAVIFLVLGLVQTDILNFVGVRQLMLTDGESRLTKTGLYRWVRHPLYLFGLAFAWLTPVMTVNLLTIFVVLTGYVLVGANLEEKRLVDELGSAYTEYQATTPMIIPSPRIRSRGSSDPAAGSKR